MPSMVSLPIEHYDLFLNKCDTFSLAFGMLKNGIIVPGSDGKASPVEVCCEVDEARELLDLAKRIYPDIVLAPKRESVLTSSGNSRLKCGRASFVRDHVANRGDRSAYDLRL